MIFKPVTVLALALGLVSSTQGNEEQNLRARKLTVSVNEVIRSLLDGSQQIARCNGTPGGTNDISVTEGTDSVDLHYNIQNYCYGGTRNQMKYYGVSPLTGSVTLDYSWVHCHSWFMAKKGALYVEDATMTQFIPYGNAFCYGSDTGSITLNLEAGENWGIILESSNYDSSKLNHGIFSFALQQVPPTLVVPQVDLTPLSTSCSSAQAFDYSGSVLATDSDGNTLVPVCSPAPGTDFPVDVTTTVTCTATDADGLSTTASFGVRAIGPSEQAWNLANGLPDTERERLGRSLMNMANKVVTRLDEACPSNKACGMIGALGNFVSAQIDYLEEAHDVDRAIIDTIDQISAAAECTDGISI